MVRLNFKSSLLVLVILFSFGGVAKSDENCSYQQFYNVAKRHGYPIQTHTTVTEDGFHLTMFRLQKGPNFVSGKPVAFIQHGFTQSSEGWMINDFKNSLPVKLIEAGFDLWLGNNRATKYSQVSDKFQMTDKQYWEFSFQQMGMYDAPAQLGYVVKTTGQIQLTYIGHSQGTSQMFAALSDSKTQQWMNQHVKHFVALAPICYMTNFDQTLIKDIAYFRTGVVDLLKSLKKYALEKNNCAPSEANIVFYESVCRAGSADPKICDMPYKMTDKYPEYVNLPLTGYFVNSKPQAFALQVMDHFAQLINQKSPRFMKFNWGEERNLQEYGQLTPPEFNLGNIKTKVTAFVGTGDPFATVADVANLKKAIPQMEVHQLEGWGHTAFMLGSQSDSVYNQLVQSLLAEQNTLRSETI